MKRFIVCIAALLACMSFAGCIEPPEEEFFTEKEEEFIPAEDYEIDAEILSEYERHKTNASLAFSGYEPISPDAFEYSEENGEVTLTKYIGQEKIIVIPERIGEATVTSVAADCFADLDVRAVYVPDSVTHIGFGAFSGCESMTTIRLPIIGDGRDNLNAGYIFGADSVDYNRMQVPSSLEMILFGEKVTEIPDNAMSGFKSLRAVILPDTVKSIGKFAFYECSELLYIRLGEGLEGIEDYAFAQCSSLIKVELGASVSSVGLGAFHNCNSIKYMTLPFVGGSMTENRFIGYIFGAEHIEWNGSFVPASLTHITLLNACDSLPDRAFSGCDGLIDVTLPEGMTSIGIRAFYNCASLRKITLPDSLTVISDDAFFYCRSLSEVVFGEDPSLSEIGMQAFFGCEKLTQPTLPEKVTIGKNAFWGCKKTEN